ncbi:MAG: glycosyltransferase [Lachnospiraceae bacterium]|nr:glycosyltransferase [Lachnospiraceae bacterium]
MVSVIIDNYNYGRYIGQAIESVLNQTYTDFEIIVVDGASNDDSKEVIEKYVSKYPEKIRAFYREKSGQAGSFNLGYKESKGDIICFLDADDYFYENKLEVVVKKLESCDFLGNARKHFGDVPEKEYISPIDTTKNRQELFRKYGYVYTYNLITSCLSAKRDLLKKILPMPEDGYITHADMYIKLMAQYYSDITYIPEVLTAYRIHNTQKNSEFKDAKASSDYLEEYYNQVFEDINKALTKTGFATVPKLTDENLEKVFNIANPDSRIKRGGVYALCGAGVNSYKLLNVLNTVGAKVKYVSDSNSSKWGTIWNGIEVISHEALVEKRSEYEQILIGTFGYHKEIAAQLESLGMKEGKDFFVPMSLPMD